MKMKLTALMSGMILASAALCFSAVAAEKIVIAHRGASGYLPEVRGKTMLLGHWLQGKEIPDPYRKSDEAFESVYRLIDQSCQHWAEKLGR